MVRCNLELKECKVELHLGQRLRSATFVRRGFLAQKKCSEHFFNRARKIRISSTGLLVSELPTAHHRAMGGPSSRIDFAT